MANYQFNGLLQINEFITSTSYFLEKNVSTLTGRDIHDLYFEFWEKMKKSIGSSSGFTGFSEFLIFHCLKGKFKTDASKEGLQIHFYPEPIRPLKGNKDDGLVRLKFVSRTPDIILGHEIPFFRNGNGPSGTRSPEITISPDITIQKNGSLTSVIEIKLDLSGEAQASEVMDRFINIRQKYPKTKCTVISYVYASKKTEKVLEEYAGNHDWFSYVILSKEVRTMDTIFDSILH